MITPNFPNPIGSFPPAFFQVEITKRNGINKSDFTHL